MMSAVMPPAHMAPIMTGFMRTYGKYTSWIPPKKWMMIAPGPTAWPGPCRRTSRQQQTETRSGVGLEHEVDRAPDLGDVGCTERREHAVVDGVVQEQHLADLDRDVGQRQQAGVGDALDHVAEGRRWRHDRADRRKPSSARPTPAMPCEKLLYNISKPAGVRSSRNSSIFFMTQPASGPMTMAPRNCGGSPGQRRPRRTRVWRR